MKSKNIVFIALSYLVMIVLFLILEDHQIDSLIKSNNEAISHQIKQTINDQLKLKNSPIIDFVPSGKANKKIVLTKEQIDLINKNIAVNSAKVDEAINTSKEEIGRDISRMSTWVTVILAAVGFLGIFFPILLNIYSTRDIEKRIVKIETSLDSAVGILKKTQEVSETTIKLAESATKSANIATSSTNTATIKIEELSALMYFFRCAVKA